MEKFNLKDLINCKNALKVLIENFEGTQIEAESEEKTLEKIEDLIRRYRID